LITQSLLEASMSDYEPAPQVATSGRISVVMILFLTDDITGLSSLTAPIFLRHFV